MIPQSVKSKAHFVIFYVIEYYLSKYFSPFLDSFEIVISQAVVFCLRHIKEFCDAIMNIIKDDSEKMNQEANRIENLAIENEEETISHPSPPPDISEKVESWIKGSMDKMSPENAWAFIDPNSDTESILSERSSDSIVIVGRDRHIVLGSVGEYVESLAGDLAESVVSKDEMEVVLRPVHRVATTPRQERRRAYGQTRDQTIDNVLNILCLVTISMALGLGIGNYLGTTDNFPPRDGGCPMSKNKENFRKPGQKPQFHLSESEERFLSSFDPKALEEAVEIHRDIISGHKAKIESCTGSCPFKDTKEPDDKFRDFRTFKERRSTTDFVDKLQDYPAENFDENEIPLTEQRKVVATNMNDTTDVNHNEEYLTEAEFYGRSKSLDIDNRKTDDIPKISDKFQDSPAEIFNENETPLTEQRKFVATDMKDHIGVNHKGDHLTEAYIGSHKVADELEVADKFNEYPSEVFVENENPPTEQRKFVATDFYNARYHDSIGADHNEEYLTEAEFYGRSENFDISSRKADDRSKMDRLDFSKAEFYGKRRPDGFISSDNLSSDDDIQSDSLSKSQFYGRSPIAELNVPTVKKQSSSISGENLDTLKLDKSTFYGKMNNYSDNPGDINLVNSRGSSAINLSVLGNILEKNVSYTHNLNSDPILARNNWEYGILPNKNEIDDFVAKNDEKLEKEMNDNKDHNRMGNKLRKGIDKRKYKKDKENEKLKKKAIKKRSNDEYEDFYQNKKASKRKPEDYREEKAKRIDKLNSKGRYYSRELYDSGEHLNAKGDMDEYENFYKRRRRYKEDVDNWESRKENSRQANSSLPPTV
ncbi:uncharacterized protein LOC136040989 isoform X2 [Artemia franciscana]|uniref:uncharacterized protein LOC136040989 isoform X2 n=1 Tax=Artemia franciscana TaxID=6661 RepID=UPI0032DBE324